MAPRWVFPIVAALTLAMAVSADAATVQITMENLVISPAEALAKVGDTIEWINKDIFAHTATARDGLGPRPSIAVRVRISPPRFYGLSSPEPSPFRGPFLPLRIRRAANTITTTASNPTEP